MGGRPATWIASLCCCLAARVACAADVSVQAPAEVYVGVPFALTVTVNDVDDFDSVAVGVIPDAPGVTVLNPDSPSKQTLNQTSLGPRGRRTIRTITLTFQVVAAEPKALTIPAFTVRADGQVHHTRPVTVIARHSFTGDLLLLDVKADREVYYLGERVEITLEIWLKPFVVPGYNREFDEHEMWALVNQRSSSFGVFEQGNERGITYRTARRLDDEGRSTSYYVYYLPASYVPRQAGELSFRDVRVVAGYPEQARPARGLITRGRWDVVTSRPIVATLDRPALRVEPTPEEGRPDVFAGAVGRFDIAADAAPREAAVGDPITLTLRIEDRSGGEAAMELLRPPLFEQVPALVEQFRIPDDPMAGDVDGARKTFTQTIRARHERVTEVPAIPFAFFDPVLQRYETVWSDPVPLEVHAAATVTSEDLVGAEGRPLSRATELTEVAGGLLANYSGPELLASARPLTLTWLHWTLLGLPPAAFAALAAGRRHAARLRDRAVARRRSAGRTALRRLRGAGGPGAAEETAAALCNYVADRLDLPPGALTRAEVVERLERAGVNGGLREQVSALLRECEQAKYAGAAGDGDAVARRARGCVERLEAEWPKGTKARRQGGTKGLAS